MFLMTVRKHRRLMSEQREYMNSMYGKWIEAHQAMMVQLGITTTKLNIHLRATEERQLFRDQATQAKKNPGVFKARGEE